MSSKKVPFPPNNFRVYVPSVDGPFLPRPTKAPASGTDCAANLCSAVLEGGVAKKHRDSCNWVQRQNAKASMSAFQVHWILFHYFIMKSVGFQRQKTAMSQKIIQRLWDEPIFSKYPVTPHRNGNPVRTIIVELLLCFS